jgi:hypothetical protein
VPDARHQFDNVIQVAGQVRGHGRLVDDPNEAAKGGETAPEEAVRPRAAQRRPAAGVPCLERRLREFRKTDATARDQRDIAEVAEGHHDRGRAAGPSGQSGGGGRGSRLPRSGPSPSAKTCPGHRRRAGCRCCSRRPGTRGGAASAGHPSRSSMWSRCGGCAKYQQGIGRPG